MDLSALTSAPAPAATPLRKGHADNVDVLRGLAALGVALSRMCTRANESFGFKQIPSFLLGRWIRLYPAFAAAAVLSAILWYASELLPSFRGGPPAFSASQIAGNATLTCDIFNLPWLNPAFWTLAIEAQYYILFALSFPLLAGSRRWMPRAAILGWIAAPLLIRTHGTVFPFGATFALGLILYASRSEIFSRTETALFAILAVAAIVVPSSYAVTLASGLSFIFLAVFPPIKTRGLLWLGSISYSLYLLHVPIGGRVILL